MRKLQKLRGAITALLSVAALVSGLTSSKADIIDTFSVSDQLVSASFSLATISGDLAIDVTTGEVSRANISVVVDANPSINLTSFSQFVDTANSGVNVMIQSGGDLDLDILYEYFERFVSIDIRGWKCHIRSGHLFPLKRKHNLHVFWSGYADF